MKLTFLKLNRDKSPSLKSLRPQLFNINLLWFICLGVILIMIIIMALIGFNFFHYQYFEDYKNITPSESTDLINIEKLKNVIGKRDDFINKEISLPPDPSI